ncbi:OLC1v1008505C1 [Oldenlandia corymbosa var. corymbosa]|uniref:OLC1v1008505C1 n=1 Tax=Oldenlandia corymbosa var. corymbosa TaxID=529605 RepID=A0AAV1DQ09_OLDCO|nr:OLC1v1008505C1 [Oldenlandia corymbosa var. corymbosa]
MISEFNPHLNWVFFHSTYDIVYLIKILTQKSLPDQSIEFLKVLKMYLGERCYDLKEILSAEPFGWRHYGLDRIASNFNLKRLARQSHQAGSDSLLTMDCFFAAMKVLFHRRGDSCLKFAFQAFNYKLYGLDIDATIIRKVDPMENRLMHEYAPVNYHPPPYAIRPPVGLHVPVMPMRRFQVDAQFRFRFSS